MSLLYDIPLFGPLFETALTIILPFLIVLSIVVFVHELGHYLVGKWCGIKADVFSIGFGREIFGWTDRHNTRWRVSLLPLGGYVKFRGDADPASAGASGEVAEMTAEERRATLTGAPIWARMLTILAGPFANFLLTIVLVFIITMANGLANQEPLIGGVAQDAPAQAIGLQAGDRVLEANGQPVSTFRALQKIFEDPPAETTLLVQRGGSEILLRGDLRRPAEVIGVTNGGAADLACLRGGDVITGVNGAEIVSFGDLRRAVEKSQGESITLTISRAGEDVETTLTPEVKEDINRDTGQIIRVYRIGVQARGGSGIAPEARSAGVVEALGVAAMRPVEVAQQTFGYIGAIFSGQADGSSLSSFVGIANVSGEAASLGVWAFIGLIALISAAIGLMNLLPIPVLDGGHLVFYAVEAVRGRPVGERWMEMAMVAGLAAVLMLMIFATVNDVSPWIAKLSAPSC